MLISSENNRCRLGFLCMNAIAYVDDLELLTDSKENLSQLYNILGSGLENLKLILNKNKSWVCLFIYFLIHLFPIYMRSN